MKMITKILASTVLSLVCINAYSSDGNDNAGYFPFKINDIYEDEAVAELFQNDAKFDEKIFLMLPIMLFNQLHYGLEIPSKDKMKEMIRQYQKDLGEKQTGILNAKQTKELLDRSSSTQSKTINVIDDKIEFEKFTNYFYAKGTWKLINNQHGMPINIVNINCYKDKRICMMSFAFVTDMMSDLTGSYSFGLYNFQYDIISWSKSEIVATHTLLCKIEKLNINFNQKEIYQFVTYNDSGSCPDFGKEILSKDEFPIISKLVPGYPESLNYWDKQNKKQSEYYSSQMKDLFGLIMNNSDQ